MRNLDTIELAFAYGLALVATVAWVTAFARLLEILRGGL